MSKIFENNLAAFHDAVAQGHAVGLAYTPHHPAPLRPLTEHEITRMVGRLAAKERQMGQLHLRTTVNATRAKLGLPSVEREEREKAVQSFCKFVTDAQVAWAAVLPGFSKAFRAFCEAEGRAQRERFTLAGPGGAA